MFDWAANFEHVVSIIDLIDDAARDRPDATFATFLDEDRVVSYRELRDAVRDTAAGLEAVVQEPNATVVTCLPTSSAGMECWLGMMSTDLIDFAVNHELFGKPMEYAVAKAGPSAVITDAEGLAKLRPALVELDRPPVLVLADQAGSGVEAGLQWFGLAELRDLGRRSGVQRRRSPTDVASVRFTSGSTGLPKGVGMSEAHLVASAMAFRDVAGIKESAVLYTCFPFHHVFASVTGILTALVSGASIAVRGHFSAQGFWSDIRRTGATVSHVIDAVVRILLKADPEPSDAQNTVEVMFTVAGEYPEFERRFGLELLHCYDMSELTLVAAQERATPLPSGSCGRLTGLFDVRLVGPDGREVPVGTPGEIRVRPRYPHVMFRGYYGDGEATVAAWQDLWFNTGDIGALSDDGHLWFRGRVADRIRRRAVNISAEEIEMAVLDHRSVTECAVIGVPGELGDDEVLLLVCLKDGEQVGYESLHEWIGGRLPKHMRPRYIEILDELPKTPTHKINKSVLRARGERGMTPAVWDADARSAQAIRNGGPNNA